MKIISWNVSLYVYAKTTSERFEFYFNNVYSDSFPFKFNVLRDVYNLLFLAIWHQMKSQKKHVVFIKFQYILHLYSMYGNHAQIDSICFGRVKWKFAQPKIKKIHSTVCIIHK